MYLIQLLFIYLNSFQIIPTTYTWFLLKGLFGSVFDLVLICSQAKSIKFLYDHLCYGQDVKNDKEAVWNVSYGWVDEPVKKSEPTTQLNKVNLC